MKLFLLFAVVVVAAFIEDVTSLECHQCITNHPSWTAQSCSSAPVTCKLGNYCFKAVYGNALTIRGCAPGGKDKDFVKKSTFSEDSVCKKVRKFMVGPHTSDALTKEFQKNIGIFEASCPKRDSVVDKLKNLGKKLNPVSKKAPKKGFTCKKKLCNAGGRNDAAAVSVIAAAAVAVLYANKSWL